ncbi:helix-turn-helix domain-containing protein [Eubacterium callanderi]|uniref:helix-turn-helix domain-containing protein n=1 Tax=Eubacterium callanderi TaxID=53442 RepID=UPI0039913161
MLNERLKALRESYDKLSQKEIAEKIGISRERYNQYETGKRNPDYETLISIAQFFDVTTDYLLGYTNTKKKSSNQSTNNENILDLDFDVLTDEEVDDTFTSYLKKQNRVMFFDPESDRSPAEKRAMLKELTKKEKERQEKIDKLNKLPDDLLEEALCYAEFRAQKKSKK